MSDLVGSQNYWFCLTKAYLPLKGFLKTHALSSLDGNVWKANNADPDQMMLSMQHLFWFCNICLGTLVYRIQYLFVYNFNNSLTCYKCGAKFSD